MTGSVIPCCQLPPRVEDEGSGEFAYTYRSYAGTGTLRYPTAISGRLKWQGEFSEDYAPLLHRGIGGGMYTRKAHATRETPTRDQG